MTTSVPQGSRGESSSRHHPSLSMFPEQVIGSYAIGETIGRGSFGKVKKGRHLHTGETVAIKILNRLKLKSANMDKKIHREIEILRLFSHPNICRLYEVISTPTDMYLIMEYIEGGELYDYIVNKGRVREAEARYIFQQVVCAIEYCHHFRVVHRDLKPENILLGPGLQVKLIDFGLSNIMKDGEFLTTSCGSPNYAAPEVISGKLYFGPEVDVWSCGVILYALLCGCLPFDDDSIPLLFSKIKKGKYSIPSSMGTGPRGLIQQILIVDPLVRVTIPQIRDNAWFNQNIPMRLSYNESLFAAQEDRIISVLASETAKRLNMREKDVRRELDKGSGSAYVAYNILLDAQRRREIAAEVRELGMTNEDQHHPHLHGASGAGGVSGVSGVGGVGTGIMGVADGFTPTATERELNLGLMLTQSPAMEVMLEHSDATANKSTYNTGAFLPASSHEGRSAGGLSASAGTQQQSTSPSVGSFRMTRCIQSAGMCASPSSPPQGTLCSTNSFKRTSAGSMGSGGAPSQLGVSFGDQPRVGSVARKHPMYTAEEEQFLVEHNVGWRIGLMTDFHAEQALLSIYDVLRVFHMEWKVLSPFQLKTRTTRATWEFIAKGGPSRRTSRSVTTEGASTTSTPIPIENAKAGDSSDDPESNELVGSLERDERGLRGRGTGAVHTFQVSPSPPSQATRSEAAVLQQTAPLEVSEPPSTPIVITIHLFRIHERHDKGFLVDFGLARHHLVGMDIILRLSDELISRIG